MHIFCINNTLAAPNIYGEPTIGDYMRENFEQTVLTAQKLAYEKVTLT